MQVATASEHNVKRACVNWGIGRELYTAPAIFIRNTDVEIKSYNGKYSCRERFDVKEISYDDKRRINHLVIETSNGKTVFTYNSGAKKTTASKPSAQKSETKPETAKEPEACLCSVCGKEIKSVVGKSGAMKTAEEIITGSTKKYGKPMCLACAMAEAKREKAGAA